MNVVWKEDQENAINRKEKDSVREEIVAVSDTMRISVQNRHQSPPSEPPTQEDGGRFLRRKSLRGRSPSGKFAGQQCIDYLKGFCTKSPCDDWHPPECQFYKTESGCKFGEKCSFAHRQVEDQASKKPKKDGDKNAVATSKDARQLGCVFSDIEPPEISSILRKSTKVLGPTRRVQISKATVRDASSEGFMSEILMSAARTLRDLRIGLRKRLSDKSDVPAETRGSWLKMF